MEAVAEHLAGNLRRLREGRGLSQQRAAELAGLPRPTWATLESGVANPTLGVLIRAAAALGVTLEDLIAAPRSPGRVTRRDELRRRVRPEYELRALLADPPPGVAFERVELKPAALLARAAHTDGWQEVLACERGKLEISADGETWDLGPGDVLVFRASERHQLRNAARELSVAYAYVGPARPGS